MRVHSLVKFATSKSLKENLEKDSHLNLKGKIKKDNN